MAGATTSAIGIWASASAGIPGLPAGGAVFLSTFLASTASYVYSADGVTWSVGTLPASNNYAGAAFGGAARLWVITTKSRAVVRSANGVSSWTNNATAMPVAGQWLDVAWSPTLSLFVAIANNIANPVVTSPDGLTWTQQTAPTAAWNNIIWSSRLGLFIAVNTGFSATIAMTSPDGVNWTSHSGTAANVGSVHDFGSLFNILGIQSGSTTFSVSSDGLTWTAGAFGTIPGGGNTIGGTFRVAGAVYSFIQAGAHIDLIKNTSSTLGGNWTLVSTDQVTGLVVGSASERSAFSTFLGMWALAEGAASNTQVLTTLDAASFVLNTPTTAIASTLNNIDVAG